MSFFLCVICDDVVLYHIHSSGSSPFFFSCTSPHNVVPMNRLSTWPSSYFPFLAQQLTAFWLIFPLLLYSSLKQGFLPFLFRSCSLFCCYIPYSLKLCGHICHICCIFPWMNFYYCVVVPFLWRSTLESSLLIILFSVFFFHSALSSITNVYIFQVFKLHLWNIYVLRHYYWILIFR